MERQKTALIVGMAKSGVGAAKLLAKTGWRVIVNDMKPEIPGLEEALAGCAYENRLGEAPEALLNGVDLLIPSPIIPMTKPFLVEAKGRGIEVISEIELGYRYAEADFVCITGTNGKTTCTALTGEMFKNAGRHTFVLGNIGVAITEHALETRPGDVIVAETAALQLEGCVDFHAKSAACCNVTEDHLDHFGTMENYILNKQRVFMNQTAEDTAVLNWDDPIVKDMAPLTPARKLYFSRKQEVPQGAFLRGEEVILRLDGQPDEVLIHSKEIFIPGPHNLENAMLSSLLACSMGVPGRIAARTLREFKGVEHRIEFVRELDGVTYYNDSKGTNPASTIKAVESMSRPIVLILGGYDKHSQFEELFNMFAGRVKAIVVLGQTQSKIIETAKRCGYPGVISAAGSFEETVDTARSLAAEGDCVLLSPACASWGMFENYEQRGRVFKQLVNGFQSVQK